jgi:DNA-binding XRE family transcriptional regulator/tetratricopeptide (TPR) repeat protein
MASPRGLSLADLLRHWRTEAGYSQEELATAAGLSRGTVSEIERGLKLRPHQHTVTSLANTLKLAGPDRATFEAAARGVRLPALSAPASPPAASISSRPVKPVTLTPLVGRARVLALLDRHLSGLTDDRPPLLLLAGEPGIGKSRLLREAAARGQAAGWTALDGGCTRRSAQEPYAPLVEALARHTTQRRPRQLGAELQGSAWLVRLLPELLEMAVAPAPQWNLPPEQERRLMFAAVGRFLANIAGPAGTLLVLDDLQWAGADALDLLATLVRSEAQRPLRIVGAYRETEVGTEDGLGMLEADLAREGLVVRARLGPLSREEAAKLLAVLLPELPRTPAGDPQGDDGLLRERILRRAGGVPFYIVSCARAAQSGALEHAEDGAADEVPWDARQSVRSRVAALPPAARALLGIAAIAGRVAQGTLLAAVSGYGEDEAAQALEAACRARLLLDDGKDTYGFAHDLIREVVEADLGPARRQTLHRRVAETLERRSEAERARIAADLAYHFGEAGAGERALPYALLAGDQAEAAYAHAEAEAQYRFALRMLSKQSDPAREAEAAFKLAHVLRQRARYDESLTLLDLAATRYQALDDVDRELQTHGAILELCGERGAIEEGQARAASMLARLAARHRGTGEATFAMHGNLPCEEDAAANGAAPPGGQEQASGRAAFYTGLADLYFYGARYAEELTAAEQAVHSARAAGNARLLRYALHARALAAWNCDPDPATGVRNFEEVRVLAEEAGDGVQVARVLNFLANIHFVAGHLEQSVAYEERGRELMERFAADPTRLAMAIGNCGENTYFCGRWQHARALFAESLATMRVADPNATTWRAAYPLINLGMIAISQGREPEGLAHLAAGLAIAEPHQDLQALRKAHGVLAERDLLAGRPDAAYARLEPLLDPPGEETASVTMRLLALVAWAECALGRVEQAIARVAECLARSAPRRCPFARPDARRVEAILAIERGRWQEAEAALEEALALARPMPYPYAEAKALYVYGRLAAARGQPQRARERYTQALAILDGLGERLYAAHIERALATPTP